MAGDANILGLCCYLIFLVSTRHVAIQAEKTLPRLSCSWQSQVTVLQPRRRECKWRVQVQDHFLMTALCGAIVLFPILWWVQIRLHCGLVVRQLPPPL